MKTQPLELRAPLRSLRKSTGFSFTAIIRIALAVATTATVLGYIRGMLLRPLSYAVPDRLLLVEAARDGQRGKLSALEVRDLDRDATTLAGVVSSPDAMHGKRWEAGRQSSMSSFRLFDVLGRPPVLGSGWPSSDDGRTPVRGGHQLSILGVRSVAVILRYRYRSC